MNNTWLDAAPNGFLPLFRSRTFPSGDGTRDVTEHELLAGCRNGSRQAQRALYDQTSARIFRLLRKMTGNEEDALDLCQETYFKAFGRIGQFDARSSITTWIYRIAVNEALQFLRKSARTRDRLVELVPQSSVSAQTDSKTQDIAIDVRDALAKLAPEDRTILLLRYQERLDYRALAHVLDTAPGTVASRLNRSRRKLQDILQGAEASAEELDTARHPID